MDLTDILDDLVFEGKRDIADVIFKEFNLRYKEGFQVGYSLGYEDGKTGVGYRDSEDEWEGLGEKYYTLAERLIMHEDYLLKKRRSKNF